MRAEEDRGSSIEWDIRIGHDGTIRLPYEFVGDFLDDRLGWEKQRRGSTRSQRRTAESRPAPLQARPPSADTYIDQRSGLLDKRMYLRLAREKAFPSKKVGKRVVARWGDVQAALSAQTQDAVDPPAEPRTEEEAMRLRWGLARRV